jgi:hypothetical protein
VEDEPESILNTIMHKSAETRETDTNAQENSAHEIEGPRKRLGEIVKDFHV